MYLLGKRNVAFFLNILKCGFHFYLGKNFSNGSILLILIHVFKAIIQLRLLRKLLLTIIFTSIFIECTWKHIASRNQELTWFLIPCFQNAGNENRDLQHTVRVVLIFYLLMSVSLLAILCLQPSTCNFTTIQAVRFEIVVFLICRMSLPGWKARSCLC